MMTHQVSSPLLSMGAFNQEYLLLDNPSRLREEGIVLRELEDANKSNRFTALEELEVGKIYLSEGSNQLEKLDSGEVELRGPKESIVLVPFSQKQQYYRSQAPQVPAPTVVPVDSRKREMLFRQEPSTSPYTLRNKMLSEQSRNLPTETAPRISDLVITGPSKRGHLGFLTLQYVFDGKEGQSLFQWERLRDSTNNHWEFIPGANEKSYSPSVEDIGCEVRARVIPVSFSNMNGTEVLSPPVELFLDNKVKEEVAASSEKKRASFEIHIGYGPNPVPRMLVVTNSRLEIHHRNRPFSFGDVRVTLKPDSLVFSHPSNPNILCFHLDPQDAAIVSSSSVMLRTSSENELSSGSDYNAPTPSAIDRTQGTDLEFICESNLERDVILMTIKHRIEQLSSQKKPEEKKQKEVVATGLQYYLTEGDWQLMLTNANEFTYQDGQVVFEQATPNNSLYRIRAGNVRIIKDGGKIIGRMGPGSVLGEMSFLGNNVTTASVIAEGEVRIAEVEVQFIKQLFEVEPLLALKFYRNIAMKLSSRLRGLTGESGEKQGVPAQVTQGKPNESWDIFARKRRTNSSENLMIREYQHCSIDNRNAVCQLYQPKLEFITKVFGFKKRNDIFYVDIDNMVKFGEAGLKIHSRKKREDKNIVFASTKDRDEVHGLVTSIMSRVNEPTTARNSSSAYGSTTNAAPADPSVNITDIATRANVGQAEAITSRPLSEEEEFQEKKDWNSIMSEAEKRIYTKGQNILAQGDLYQRLYQVAKGRCVIDINEGVIGEVNEGEIFGEMSFLQLRSASAAITAASETVELYVIEGYKLNRLIRQNTALGARFFKYIALVLEGRVQKREAPTASVSRPY
eukprot:TRINITY_DN517_c0_g1_i3.p1 TRINITY_DN517_c0_g1~~TRINITY_DN517_c0_g1_i3.p1  ORF type:complete len:851 (-),score=358.21 TRINITY_DN517_c0_g1_i3:50-2602(-)